MWESTEEEWFFNQNWQGTCETAIDRTSDLILYPGYRCRGDEVEGNWYFGTKIWNSNNRCEGYTGYSACRRSSDCNFGYYCSEDGIWLTLNENGESCTTHDSCTKNNLCYYESPTQTYGTCVKVNSRDERELVQPEHNGLPVNQEDMEKLWRTGMVNRTTGRCATKLQSKNKGQVCTTDADWPTTDSNINAACKCGYNADGNSYCDIEAGDTEWVEATTLFQDFYLLNLDCHTAEGFGNCGQAESVYFEYKCAEFKAKHYVELLNNPDWLKDNYDKNPYFWEYSEYCHSAPIMTMSFFIILWVILLLLIDN